MTIAIVDARYLERGNLEAFLGRIFEGKASVKWERGHFKCNLPRGLTQPEFDEMKKSVEFEHYNES
ncbi:hypothetical protein BCR34DRAFT_606235 [Clohesyomyces aquaticus]|uniref:Uncharacterized protein n=1 Tax=Clohesyomyces aquaticus TaxID=1231657 RepID=A0A1Y1YR97_9PLEO|nr:hypothetical protein BCR34DRAFT_606235 [Clohesyomyces aquaticus]